MPIEGGNFAAKQNANRMIADINWPLIRQTCGKLLLLESAFMGAAVAVAAYYWWKAGETDTLAILIPAIACMLTGWVLKSSAKNVSTKVSLREGYIVVSGMWLVFSVFGMMPYLINGTCSQLCDAFLETMSGFTTTGCTILENIDEQPHGILFWRSLTQWIGGLGIVVFSLALLPRIESGNIQMFSAEVTGMSVDKLRPRIQDTSRYLWIIYVGLTTACGLLYFVGGMSIYDAVCHAMTTLATGGFSTHQSSIGWFQSTYIEYVCTIFLFIASVNFSLFYMIKRGRMRQFWQSVEFRWFVYIVVGFTIYFLFLHYFRIWRGDLTEEKIQAMPHGFADSLRTSLFHVVTVISTCGFQAEYYDYQLWGRIFWIPTLFIMACGGCAGSTAGGFKILRLVIMIKNLRTVMRQSINTNVYDTVMLDNRALRQTFIQRTLAFVLLFFLISFVGIVVMMPQGIDMGTAIGTTISAIGNCGPGLGQTGPAFTWAGLPTLSKWVLSMIMLIGRLEIFTFILLFTRVFWLKR